METEERRPTIWRTAIWPTVTAEAIPRFVYVSYFIFSPGHNLVQTKKRRSEKRESLFCPEIFPFLCMCVSSKRRIIKFVWSVSLSRRLFSAAAAVAVAAAIRLLLQLRQLSKSKRRSGSSETQRTCRIQWPVLDNQQEKYSIIRKALASFLK